MTDLQHLQKVILYIMKDIDKLCRKNGIEYYLFGGSAIGAVRHKGFIPWDDDLDIVMDHNNYERFIQVCCGQLDTEKYYFQEGLVDWPSLYSKIRLKGTKLEESESYGDNADQGIFVDVFKLDNAPDSKVARRWQYVCGKIVLSFCLLQRGYRHASLKKKCMMLAAFPLKIKGLRDFFMKQMYKFNKRDTNAFVSLGARFRYKQSFFRKDLYAHPIYLPFEDTELPVPEKYDEMLTLLYGDYMTPPPVSEQQGGHMLNVDFGNY